MNRFILGALLPVSVALWTGCGSAKQSAADKAANAEVEAANKAIEEAEKAGKEIIPGEKGVHDAIRDKQWMNAVNRLIALRPAVASEEQKNQFRIIAGDLRDQLLEIEATDAKAREALMMYRATVVGR